MAMERVGGQRVSVYLSYMPRKTKSTRNGERSGLVKSCKLELLISRLESRQRKIQYTHVKNTFDLKILRSVNNLTRVYNVYILH